MIYIYAQIRNISFKKIKSEIIKCSTNNRLYMKAYKRQIELRNGILNTINLMSNVFNMLYVLNHQRS